MTTKITALTGLNIDAVEQIIAENLFPHGQNEIIVRKTTVEFPWTPDATLAALHSAKQTLSARYGSRQHPVASLHAVIRKVARLTEEN